VYIRLILVSACDTYTFPAAKNRTFLFVEATVCYKKKSCRSRTTKNLLGKTPTLVRSTAWEQGYIGTTEYMVTPYTQL